MKRELCVSVLGFMLLMSPSLRAETFSLDTIDNWQIYNGTVLVLAGHEPMSGASPQGIIRINDLKELTIRFNHCGYSIVNYDVVEILDEQGRRCVLKTFKSNFGTGLVIERAEWESVTAKAVTIHYKERRLNGTDKILGKIRFT